MVKLIVILTCLLILSNCSKTSLTGSSNDEFSLFAAKYRKSYKDLTSLSEHKHNYIKNSERVKQLNMNHTGVEFECGEFCDLDHEAMKKMTGLKPPTDRR